MDKFIEKFRAPELVKRALKLIERNNIQRELNFMEVCGTHTMSIRRFGIHELIPQNINLLSGPGCPVCVTPTEYIDTALELLKNPDLIITTFGDMVKVPGTKSSLEKEAVSGKAVKVVYSPFQALKIAENMPSRKVVFLAIGFETTVPLISATLQEAVKRGIENFYILSGNKCVPPALKVLLDDPEIKIDGFLLPGHVCTVWGYREYEFIPQNYGIPCAVSGFEPLDILLAINSLLLQIKRGKPEVKNMYPRAVKRDGNLKAKKLVRMFFQEVNSKWRGFGEIEKSGFELKEKFKKFDILNHYPIREIHSKDNPLCRCGDVLKGKVKPPECKLFGRGCTPEHPQGPCMVSSEGTCAAYYKYGGLKIWAKK